MHTLTLALAATLVAQPAADLAAFVQEGKALWEVPGIAVAAIEGERVETVTLGTTRLGGGKPVTADTAFAAASTTKAMVGAAIAVLVDQERVRWTDPVSRYFPELRFKDPYIDRHMRVIDLLTHSSGVPSTDAWDFTFRAPLQKQIELMADVDSTAPFGGRFQYQNTMWVLGGELIRRVTGLPWWRFVRDQLWRPIGMSKTHQSLAAAKRAGLRTVQPHHRTNGKMAPIPFYPLPEEFEKASGSVWTTVNDMARWAQFLLRGGVTAKGERLISEEQMAVLFEPHRLIGADDFYPTHQLTKPKWRSYGVGWFQQDYAGRRIDFHTGSLSGLCAILGLDRDANRAVVVLENADHAELRHAIMWEVFDPSRDWNREVKELYDRLRARGEERRAEFEAKRVDGTQPSLPLKAYAGTYRNPTWGDIEVRVKGERLEVVVPTDRLTLSHWHHDTFVGKAKPWHGEQTFEFGLGRDGEVSYLVPPSYMRAVGLVPPGPAFGRVKE